MTDKQEEKNNRPDFEVFSKAGEKHWCRIGAAWWKKDKTEISISLNALPASQTVYLAKPKDKEQGQKKLRE